MHSNGLINKNDKKVISRHGIMCDLEDVFRVANDILKTNARIYMINRTLRLVDIMVYARKYNLEPKSMRFVHSRVGKAPKLVLVEFVKGGKPEVKVLEPLYVYKDNGGYTQEILDIYSRSEEHTSELQSRQYLVCRLLLEKTKHNTRFARIHHAVAN